MFECVTPGGRASFDPMTIISTILVEVYNEMLHTKYQSSTHSSFSEEKFPFFLPMFELLTPWQDQLCPYRYKMNKSGKVPPQYARCQISKLYPSVLQKKSFKDFLICSYVRNCDCQGRASSDPRGIIETNLQRSTRRYYIPNIKDLHLSNFREDKFLSFPSLY